MGLLKIIHNAYSTQRKTNHRHKKTDSVYVLGATAGTLCITTGGFMFAFLSLLDAMMYSLMGLFWVVYGLVCFILLGLYNDGKNTAVGHMFLVLGVLGAFLGVGFFLGGMLMAITGVLVLVYAKK
ncbi:MAG: hypothetical protein KAI53_04700 [Candidatus Aenigmarchaeota archaeon]|nr:hypothetical protein [Candidatus Aenigmarchaeota archaeon]